MFRSAFARCLSLIVIGISALLTGCGGTVRTATTPQNSGSQPQTNPTPAPALTPKALYVNTSLPCGMDCVHEGAYWQLTAFSIDSSTGALTQLPPAATGFTGEPASAFAQSADGARLAIAFDICCAGDIPQVALYSVDPTTGFLTPRAAQAVNDAGNLAFSPDGRFLYLAHESGITGFLIDSTTSTVTPLAPDPLLPINGRAVGVAVYPSGKFLYTLDSHTSVIHIAAIDSSTGSLTPIADSSPLASTPDASFPGGVAIDSGGRFLFAVSQGADALFAFSIDPATGSLTPVFVPPTPRMLQPYSVAVSPQGFVYVGSAQAVGGVVLNSFVVIYQLAADGSLRHSGGFGTFDSLTGWAVDPSGRYFYFSTPAPSLAAHSILQAFAIDTTTGLPHTPIGPVIFAPSNSNGPGAWSNMFVLGVPQP